MVPILLNFCNKGYIVHGIKRRTSLFNTDRIDHLYRDRHEKDVRFFLHHGDMTDSSSLTRIIQQVPSLMNCMTYSRRPKPRCCQL